MANVNAVRCLCPCHRVKYYLCHQCCAGTGETSSLFGLIKTEIYRATVLLGANDHNLFCAIGSWGETLPDEDVLAALKAWNETAEKELTLRLRHYMDAAPRKEGKL